MLLVCLLPGTSDDDLTKDLRHIQRFVGFEQALEAGEDKHPAYTHLRPFEGGIIDIRLRQLQQRRGTERLNVPDQRGGLAITEPDGFPGSFEMTLRGDLHNLALRRNPVILIVVTESRASLPVGFHASIE